MDDSTLLVIVFIVLFAAALVQVFCGAVAGALVARWLVKPPEADLLPRRRRRRRNAER